MQFLENDIKEYEATLQFGLTTDTLDKTGKVIATSDIKNYQEEEIIHILQSFLGSQQQIPPKYSAIKVNGKKLYEYARKNEEVPIQPRKICICQIQLLNYTSPYLSFRVVCSKGTYIRSLAYDIAQKLAMEGYLIALKRIKIGKLDVKNSFTLQQIKEGNYQFLSLLESLSLKQVIVNDKMKQDILYGKKVICAEKSPLVAFVSEKNELLAVYEKKENYFQCVRGLYHES